MEDTGKKFAEKILQDSPEGVCKDIIFKYLGGTEIDQAIEEVLLGTDKPQKKPRKKRVKKGKPFIPKTINEPDSLGVPTPSVKERKVSKRKSLEAKCAEMEANYPELWSKAVINVGPMATNKQVEEEFRRLFK